MPSSRSFINHCGWSSRYIESVYNIEADRQLIDGALMTPILFRYYREYVYELRGMRRLSDEVIVPFFLGLSSPQSEIRFLSTELVEQILSYVPPRQAYEDRRPPLVDAARVTGRLRFLTKDEPARLTRSVAKAKR